MQLQSIGFSAHIGLFARCLGLSTTLAFCAAIAHAQSLPQPNWDLAEALQVATAASHESELAVWLQQIDRGDAAQLLHQLKDSKQANHPAFEAQLFELALALGEAPLDAEVDDVLLWLADYSSQVLVAHEERADYGVALYPVAAAALGAQAERQRQRGQNASMALLNSGSQLWIERYLTADSFEQQGMTQSLSEVRIESIRPLAAELQQQVAVHPELAAPAGAVASALADTQLFLSAYQFSQGAGSAELLREANWRLDAADRNELLAGIMALPEQDKAALGISLLAPALQKNPVVSDSLLQLLDDPQLGAAAALALAGHPDLRVQAQLQQMLQSGGLKARRAALALDQASDPETAGDPQ